jgi:hypothetical protein
MAFKKSRQRRKSCVGNEYLFLENSIEANLRIDFSNLNMMKTRKISLLN